MKPNSTSNNGYGLRSLLSTNNVHRNHIDSEITGSLKSVQNRQEFRVLIHTQAEFNNKFSKPSTVMRLVLFHTERILSFKNPIMPWAATARFYTTLQRSLIHIGNDQCVRMPWDLPWPIIIDCIRNTVFSGLIFRAGIKTCRPFLAKSFSKFRSVGNEDSKGRVLNNDTPLGNEFWELGGRMAPLLTRQLGLSVSIVTTKLTVFGKYALVSVYPD